MKAQVRLLNRTTKTSPFHKFHLGAREIHKEEINEDNTEELRAKAICIAQSTTRFIANGKWHYQGTGIWIYQETPLYGATEQTTIELKLLQTSKETKCNVNSKSL